MRGVGFGVEMVGGGLLGRGMRGGRGRKIAERTGVGVGFAFGLYRGSVRVREFSCSCIGSGRRIGELFRGPV